jgi:ADP-ribose pyrophosphatase
VTASKSPLWKTVARREVLDAHPWLSVWEEDLELPAGRRVEGYYTVEMPDYVVIVALTIDGHVVVERGYRHGPRRICLTLPAGYIEHGEEPLAAARRELLEETGYVADQWQALGSFTSNGNRGCGVAHMFLAQHARQVAEPDAGDLEEMVIELMSLPRLTQAVQQGEVAELAAAAAICLALSTQLRSMTFSDK